MKFTETFVCTTHSYMIKSNIFVHLNNKFISKCVHFIFRSHTILHGWMHMSMWSDSLFTLDTFFMSITVLWFLTFTISWTMSKFFFLVLWKWLYMYLYMNFYDIAFLEKYNKYWIFGSQNIYQSVSHSHLTLPYSKCVCRRLFP